MTSRLPRALASMVLAVLAFALLAGLAPTTAAADTSASGGTAAEVVAQPAREGSDLRVARLVWDDTGLAGGSPQSLLPAWRWSDGTGTAYGNYTDINVGISPELFNFVASMSFALAQFLWQILLFIFQAVLTTDLAYTANALINGFYTTLSDAILGSTLLALPLVGVLWVGGRALLRGDSRKVVRLVIVFALAIGTMQGLASIIDERSSSDQLALTDEQAADLTDEQVERLQERFSAFAEHIDKRPPTLSPGWFALEGQILADSIAREMVEPFVGLDDSRLDITDFPSGVEGDTSASCHMYVKTLYDTFEYAQDTQKGQTTGSATGDLLADGSTVMLASLSKLWEMSYLPYWRQAHFGDSPDGGRNATCHAAEIRSGVPTAQRVALAHSAGYPHAAGYPSTDAISDGIDADERTQISETDGLWRRTNGSYKQITPNVMPFLMCTFDGDGNGTARPEFHAYARNLTGDALGDTDDCTKLVFADGDFSDNGNSNFNPYTISEVTGAKYGTHQAGDRVYPTANTALPVLTAWVGFNYVERTFYGVMALVIAFSFLWAFGRMAIGLLAVQLALVGLMACLPVTLLALAFPSSRDGASGSQKFGVKMLKMTGGMFISKGMYTIFIVVSFLAIFLVRQLIEMSMGTTSVLGSAGFVTAGIGSNLARDVLMAAAPLLAMRGIRKLMEMMKLGDITKFSGALATPMALGLKTMGEHSAASRVQSAYKGLDSATDKAKSMAKSGAKLAGKGALAAGAVAAGIGAKKWWDSAGKVGSKADGGYATKKDDIKNFLAGKAGKLEEQSQSVLKYGRRAALAYDVLGRGGTRMRDLGKKMDHLRAVEAGDAGGVMSMLFGTGTGGVNPNAVSEADVDKTASTYDHLGEVGANDAQAETFQRTMARADNHDERAATAAELYERVNEMQTGHKDPVLVDDATLAAQRKASLKAATGADDIVDGMTDDEVAEWMVGYRGGLGPMPDPRKSAEKWAETFGATAAERISSLDYVGTFRDGGSFGSALADALEVSPDMFGDMVAVGGMLSGTIVPDANGHAVMANGPGRMNQLDGASVNAVRYFAEDNHKQRLDMASYASAIAQQVATGVADGIRQVQRDGIDQSVSIHASQLTASATQLQDVVSDKPDLSNDWATMDSKLDRTVDKLAERILTTQRRAQDQGRSPEQFTWELGKVVDDAMKGPLGELTREMSVRGAAAESATLARMVDDLADAVRSRGHAGADQHLGQIRELLADKVASEQAANEQLLRSHEQLREQGNDQLRGMFEQFRSDLHTLHDRTAEVRLAEAASDPNFDGNVSKLVKELEKQHQKADRQMQQLFERIERHATAGNDRALAKAVEQLTAASQKLSADATKDFGEAAVTLERIEHLMQREAETARVYEARRSNSKANVQAAEQIERMARAAEASQRAAEDIRASARV